ncbi:MarR family winged helix-turn-helix transcriptional regulator [Lysobacter arvi]|uniref:MarR family transcriptional regulator n=1 Tax=Lysobacter arvi TaxID=3038776 RepID=A0ABU1CH14_9GAMM|nr:MarR family transcriptional regulator [Lysobacter arvi]MDR0184245.1 MarR family transcriptional regulator [Lysobacter arvi]
MAAKAKTPFPLDEQLCFSLYGASIAINRAYKPLLDELGLTYPQYLVLSSLWEDDGLTVSGIGARLALEASTITPLVKRLEQAGLVERRRSERDERQVHVQLTQAGRNLHSRTRCLAELLADRSGMAPRELVELNRQVQRLRDAMSGSAQQD